MNPSQSNKVLVQTVQPLGGNYGGVLQAYALQKVLIGMGLDATTIHGAPRRAPLPRRAASWGKRLLLERLLRRPLPLNPSPADLLTQRGRTLPFVHRHLKTVDLLALTKAERDALLRQVRGIVVGSDQVWRNKYSPIEQQLLDYASGHDLVRISYAASFGTDDLLPEYPLSLIRRSRDLARAFDAISVREDSGVEVARKYWDLEAQQHVDPTLLLDAEIYAALVNDPVEPLRTSEGNLFAYVLDRTAETDAVVKDVTRRRDLQSFELLPPTPANAAEMRRDPDRYRLPPVEQWLKSIIDAEFVVTDSFHGTVFSILFRKPFVSIGNAARGLSRFTSLLRLLELEEHLLVRGRQAPETLLDTPDWASVDRALQRERARSTEYLSQHLSR